MKTLPEINDKNKLKSESRYNLEQRLDSIIDSVAGNHWWKDLDGHYLGCNNNVAKTLGTTIDDIVGRTDYELPWAGQADELVQNDKKVIAEGITIRQEEQVATKSGKILTFLVTKSPLKNAEGKIIGTIGNSIDITHIKEMEQKLKRAKELEAKSQNAKIQGMMEIAAGIAHEIRTPLISIQFATDAKEYMDRLIAGYKMAEEAGLPVTSIRPSHMQGLTTIFQSIDKEAQEAMQIIDMFLNNLKATVKEADTGDYQLCSIKESIKTALARYPFEAGYKKLVHYNDTDDFKFYGVSLLVQHIIFNLMKNALYYASCKPGAKICIWPEHGDTGNYLHFKDTGPGVSEYDQKHIFDFGFSKRKDGSGFGLTYCKTTMQQMGGSIEVSSELGKYTEFVLVFPKYVD